MSEKTKLTRLSFADGLRGIAAVWVVLFHMSEGHHIETIRNALPKYVDRVFFDWGHLGVAIFFVLSGFVMALTSHNVRFNFAISLKFITRRLARLAPPYYFAIAITLTLLYVKSKALHIVYHLPVLNDLINHVFFIQDMLNSPQINTVFWTLCIEVQFYIAFALLVWIADYLQSKYKLANARNISIILACCIALLWPLNVISTSLWSGGFIGFWFSFLAGVIICWGWLNKGVLLKVAIIYCLILLTIGLIKQDDFALVAAITASLLLFAGLNEKMHTWLNLVWLQWLGLISYSLYLLHNPITGASFRIISKKVSGGLMMEIIAMCTTLVTCLLVAYLSFLIIERPSIKWSHQFKLKK